MTNLSDELAWRGLVYHATEGLAETLGRDRVTAYIGFDPTAPSLHVGSLLQIMLLARLQRFGHVPIAIVGGGTGMIGDPSGKGQERLLLSDEQIELNLTGIRRQLDRFLEFGPGVSGLQPARIVNNAEWLGTIDLISFLRDIGKHFTVNYMLQKESVSRRLESQEGISYTEFSYLLLQAFDFLQLFDRFGCTVQMGGSDQWGNITAGIDLIRRLRRQRVHGLVVPLVTSASGQKFGKTEAGTIWLDPARTSPFRFYQFWLNTADRDVISYLKYFTFLERGQIDEYEMQARSAPEERTAQRTLARIVTTQVHGMDEADRAERASRVLFGEDIRTLKMEDVLAVFDDVPSTSVLSVDVSSGVSVVDLFTQVGLASSKSEARRLAQSGGLYVNNRRVSDSQARLTIADAIDGRLFVLRKGARQNHLVRLT
ncbi:MAG: tyrosine--tRNA ligase [Blastocatellia bacterium]|nr:MAG: tyrosine--tRNA ligase [Blastocatellia bacterium]